MNVQLIDGPVGSLQILVDELPVKPRALAVICHPHPLHGGSFTNKVVHQLSRTFIELGAVGVRFNFRGVGDSQGVYAEGVGELDDLVCVVNWAKQKWPDLPLWLAGFSFGGSIALEGAGLLEPNALVTVAPAIEHIPPSFLPDETLQWLLIHGDSDEIIPADTMVNWVTSLKNKPDFMVVEDAGHFFHGKLNELKKAVQSIFIDDSS